MAAVEVVEVESSSQLNTFIHYPNRLYKDDPNYVTPLTIERKEFFDPKKNPFFRIARTKLFLAMKGNEVVGRIATCVNFNHNDYHEEQVGAFGFFDCEDDYEVASTLLKVAMITLKREGMEKMRGPLNFSTNHECGMLVDGFDSPPVVMMTYNQPYLPKLLEKFGLKKAMDLLAFICRDDEPIPPRIARVSEKLMQRNSITIRALKMSDFKNEIQKVREVYNKAWQNNWGFVPLEEDEFNFVAQNLKQVVDPDIVFFAEHEGQPVAFSLALPDINQALIKLKGKLFPFGLLKLLWHTKIRNKVDGLRLITFGVIPEYQKRGIDSLMFYHTYTKGVAKGYHWAELSWILESNDLMVKGAEQMGAKLYKKYRIYEIPL